MRGNDISNRMAPYVLFDIDSLLFLEKERKGVEKFLHRFKSDYTKFMEREFDPNFVRLLQSVWQRHNVCIGLVTFSLTDTEEHRELEDRLSHEFVPYTRLLALTEWESLRDFTHSIYTFSANDELLSFLSKKEALHIDKIREVLG